MKKTDVVVFLTLFLLRLYLSILSLLIIFCLIDVFLCFFIVLFDFCLWFLSLLRLIILALFDCANKLLSFLIFLKLLLFDDFRHIKRGVFKWRFAFVWLDDFHKGSIDWKLFDIVILELACGIILRTDDFKLALTLRQNHSFNTGLAKSMATHT